MAFSVEIIELLTFLNSRPAGCGLSIRKNLVPARTYGFRLEIIELLAAILKNLVPARTYVAIHLCTQNH